MDLYDKTAKRISNLQKMPESRRHSIFIMAMAFSVLLLGVLGIVSTKNNLERFQQQFQSASLLKSDLPPIDQFMTGRTQPEAQEIIALPEWKNYDNVDYLYRISYPSDWAVDVSKPEQVTISLNDALVQIKVTSIEENSSLDQQAQIVAKNLTSDVFSMTKITIAGQEGFLIESVCQEENCGPTERLVMRNNTLYTIHASLGSDSIIDQIISTFSFI